jgi:ectoine hydroxylase-related dioxygenase (phytanoyl-CoA dioxygenase family)
MSDAFQYTNDGYTVVRGLFTPGEVEEMRAAFDRLEERAKALRTQGTIGETLFVVEPKADGRTRIERIVWCGGVEPILGELGRTQRLLSPAAALLGSREMDQLINQAHIKNPGDGVSFHFHQDSFHRRYGTDLFHDVNGRGSFVQTLTALDRMDPENGGLLVIPRSHQIGHVPTRDGHLPSGSFDPAQAIPLQLEPGDVAFLNPFTVHGSGPNHGTTKRRLFINGFASPGANRREYPGAGRGLRLTALEAPRAA